MALLALNDQNSIGVKAVDDEHSALIELLNSLHAAVMKGQELSHTIPLLCELADATRTHFAWEEKIMAAAGYPGQALHRLKHKYLLEQVEALVARCGRGGFVLNEYPLNFLRDWLNTHIQNEDHNFGLWLNEHGKR
jgi:hemerythrin-like metal-binding protein